MKNTMENQKNLNAPWSLYFDRDGVEDMAILCDDDGEVMVQSRAFWLPEENDPMPPILTAMQLMKSAPELLDILESLIARISELEGLSSVIDEDLMEGEAYRKAVALLTRFEPRATMRQKAKARRLQKSRPLVVTWCIEDVREIRPDLDDDQAGTVLRSIEKHHDCNSGVTWDTLEFAASKLYPQLDTE